MTYTYKFPAVPDRVRNGIAERRCRVCGNWKSVATLSNTGRRENLSPTCERGRRESSPSARQKVGRANHYWRQYPVHLAGSTPRREEKQTLETNNPNEADGPQATQGS